MQSADLRDDIFEDCDINICQKSHVVYIVLIRKISSLLSLIVLSYDYNMHV
jgi:hypothetical protein